MSILSCEEREMGCLDPLASNFNVSADRSCCCDYPTLEVSVQHRYDGDIFGLGDLVDTMRDLRIERFVVLISDIELMGVDGQSVGIDSLWRYNTDCGNGFPRSTRADLLVSSGQQSRVLGTFAEPGDYTGVRFLVGLRTELDGVCLFRESEILNPESALYMPDDSTYAYGLFGIDQGGTALEWTLQPGNPISVSLEWDSVVTIGRGEGFDLDIFLDYKELMVGIEGTMTPVVAEQILRQNLSQAFYLF